MAAISETVRNHLAAKGYSLDQALFLGGVCAFFLLLPVHTDTTATVLIMTALAVWCGKKQGAFDALRARGVKIPLAAFAFFVAIALIASLLNPATLPKFPRILLWACCVFSGVMFTVSLPRAGGVPYWGLFAAIIGSLLVAVIFLGYSDPSLWHGPRLKLFAIHPSRLGLYCGLCFFFLLHRAIAAGPRERAFSVVAALLTLFILVKTNTRGSLLMLPLGAVCFAAALPRRYWKRFGLALLLCSILAGGSVWMNKDSSTGRRVFSALTNVTQDPTFRTRLPIWEIGWESFKTSPVIGHGHQSYLELHRRYLVEHKAELDAKYNRRYEKRVKQAHNILLGRLVETGLLGTVAFLVFYGGAIVAAWRGPQSRRWLIAPLVFYFALSMFDDGLFRMNDAIILFIAGAALPANRNADSLLNT
ncbi:O-antigen ligase family protein [Desulfovibrio sp. OttesenSCG-928-O18]|nr:O-antigen ligase family protein [Desulfovibrio sp. OttesenSCG-928-O18]